MKRKLYNNLTSPQFQRFLPPILSDSQTIKYIKNKKIVWHTCTPKSASSSFGAFNQIVLKDKAKFFTSVSIFGNVPQFPNNNYIAKQLLTSFQRVCVSTHQHSLATMDFIQILSKNHTIICQTRPILDTIVSILNFMNQGNSKVFFSPKAYLYWENLSFEEKIKELILTYLPWHVHYLQTWIIASENYDVQFIYFDDVVKKPSELFFKIFRNMNLSISIKDIEESELALPKMKFNKGTSHQGEKLIPKKVIERIGSIVDDMDKLNQSLVNYL